MSIERDATCGVMRPRWPGRRWVALRLVPLKTRLQQTFLGRLAYWLLRTVGYFALFCGLFAIAMVLVGLLTWMLIEIREPLRVALGISRP